jgi:hypothetical protein
MKKQIVFSGQCSDGLLLDLEMELSNTSTMNREKTLAFTTSSATCLLYNLKKKKS